MNARFWATAAAGVLAMSLTIGTANAGSVPESSDPIKVVVNDWTGQHVSTYIAGNLLKKMGYNIEYVTAGALPQHPGLAQGNLHLQTEVWTNNVGDIYPKAIESGDIEVLGDLGLDPKEGWIYPPYMEEKCPGLPDYKALYDCALAFARPDTLPKGRLITYPADWGTRSKAVVAGIGMPFEAIAGGSEGAMVAELKSAYAAKEPIIMMFWQPHWIFAEHKFNWVKWNASDGECVEESQKKETACGFQQARVHKVAWKGFKDKWPAAHKFMKSFTLTNEIENLAILEIDTKQRPLDKVVSEWIENNKSTWQPWVDEAMK